MGKLVKEAVESLELFKISGLNPTIINARFIKPIDTEMIENIAKKHKFILTLEDGSIAGGFGSSILEYFSSVNNNEIEVLIHGIPDKYIDHGTQAELYEELQLNAEGILKISINRFFAENNLAM